MNIHLQIYASKIKNFIKQPLITNILIVGAVTFFLKIISFYKETVVVSSFGLSELLDTFYIALLIPNFIQNVFMSALKNIFIPNYIAEISEKGNKGEFQSIIFIITFLISSFFFILIFVLIGFFIKYFIS